MAKMIKDHDFYCTLCGNKGIPVCRTSRNVREAGHLKKLFCMKCNKEANHVECVAGSKYSYDDFKNEFESGNFNQEGMRVLPIGEWKDLNYVDENPANEEPEANMEEWMELFGIKNEGSDAGELGQTVVVNKVG